MALDIVLAIVPTIADYTIAPILRHISYPFKYKSNTDTLKQNIADLKNARERLQHSVDEATNNADLIEEDVLKWMSEVDKVAEKTEKELKEDEERAKKRCFIGLCPNFKTRYQLSKKAEEEAVAIVELGKQRDGFTTVSYHAPPQARTTFSEKDCNVQESRMSIAREILDKLKDTVINMIGVYGLGGVGKTTLAKEVARLAMEDRSFDAVVTTVVTQNPDVRRIQQEIADQLGLVFVEGSEIARAGKLSRRLQQEKVLLILDDLWMGLDLESVGIPLTKTQASENDPKKGCKILLTSRELDVLSIGMDCPINYPIGVLPEAEAWQLFKKIVGDIDQSPIMQTTAIGIAKKCAGLPVAIVTVAGALRNKHSSEWKNAFVELQRPSSGSFHGIQGTTYSSIEFSYNHLANKELKSTFLVCSLLPRKATHLDLLKYGFGLGLFGEVFTVGEARDRVYSLVNKLKALCLLLESDGELISMHDVVHDVAILIASRDSHAFVTSNEVELRNWLDTDVLKKSIFISLSCNITAIPEDFECPRLTLFRIDGKGTHMTLPENTFRGTQQLKVLDLTNFPSLKLPSSLGFLKNLRTLCIHEFEEADISVIGELNKVEILSFVESSIKELPMQVGQLTNLKLLDLSDCSELEVFPPHILPRLLRLEELYLGNSFKQWEDGRRNASLSELKQLSHLNNLEIQFHLN